jgi:phage regulatory protein, rha family
MSTNLPVVQVAVHDGKPTVTSLQVAEAFGKEHKEVLRDIRNLKVSKGFDERNFAPVKYYDSKGESRPMLRMTRDGFMILAMGYTGAKAMALKEAYIAEFNRMEAELANRPYPALPDFTDPAAAAIAWAEQYKAKALAEQQLALAAPKAEVYDAVVADRRLTLNAFCRRLRGVNLLKVKESLLACGVLYRSVGGRVYRVYAKYRNTHFEEKFDSATGGCTVLVLEEGQKLLTNLYNSGQLIMKQGYDHYGSGVAE